ncbi:MAG: DUF1294 domain-containing protein [Verrucomicrobiota bacterium]
MYPNLYYILGVLNVIAFLAFGLDKLKAKTGKRRIPEATLFLLSALAASPGALLGMVLFNHKTSKAKFRYGIPALLILQIAAYAYLTK